MTDELFSVDGKVAVITGGSRGIGYMIAEEFVKRGCRVYITARKAEACDAAAAELSKSGECISIPSDLSKMDGIDTFASAISDKEGALHILINNAGAAWGAPMEEYPEEGWDKVMDTNVKAVFFLTTKLLPLLRKASTSESPARVINVGSIDGLRVPILQNYAYSASKAAVHMLTRHLAHHLVEDGITVNAIAPGPFPSKMTKFMFDMGEETVAANVPLGRAGRPSDVAGTALFLASPAGSYLTGAVIPVDGGIATR
jgi:NAD(P)-dependent dehydrogenase (short-subunit alcohol dehydrogenase family)